MIELNVKHDIDAIVSKLRANHEQLQRAIVPALNRTVEGAQTQMVRAISQEYLLTQAEVRDRLRLKRAYSKSSVEFSASLIGNPYGRNKRAMNVIRFAIGKLSRAELKEWKSAKGMRKPQIPFQIKRAGGRVYIKGAFIANDGRTVFVRVGKERLPIEPKRTIGIPQMFTAGKQHDKIVAWIRGNFPRIFERELKYRMGQIK